MAEALARRFAGNAVFYSRGVAASGGPASEMAIRILAERYGIDLSGHVSRPLTEADVRGAGLILTMTASHRKHVSEMFPFAKDRLYTLYGLAFAVSDEKLLDIADPFMCGFDVYAACAAEIKRCIDSIDFSNYT